MYKQLSSETHRTIEKYTSMLDVVSHSFFEKHSTHVHPLPKSTMKENYSEQIVSKKINGTVICHFYNESYLLPFWLEHHRSMFNHGIMIDYHSTDDSVDIIRKMCPTWEIRISRNKEFDAPLVDREVMNIENEVSGYKCVLNVTEFLIASKPLESNEPNKCFRCRAYAIVPDSMSFEPKNYSEFLSNIKTLSFEDERGWRALHSYSNGNYSLGRHTSNNPSEDNPNYFIVWAGFYPWNEQTIKRKLQIQNNIPNSNKIRGWGYQHLWDTKRMEEQINHIKNRPNLKLITDLYQNHRENYHESPKLDRLNYDAKHLYELYQ